MSLTAVPWSRPPLGRDPDEEHRATTPLELFFDLCFVVAVAAAAAGLHHDLSAGHLSGLSGYLVAFFGIWWAWVNYSWFASAFDSGDVVQRLGTFVIMAGVLVLAAGVPRAQGEQHDFRVLVAGYVIMRLGLVPLWLRVARSAPAYRTTALRYAGSIVVVQVAWVLRTWLVPHATVGWVLFGLLVLAELAIPAYAERANTTPWHRHHVAERYELFTIIVLGEVLLATTQAISGSLEGHGLTTGLALVIAGGLLVVFGLWWLYFKRPLVDCLEERTSFAFGYVHYVVFAAVAAVGAALGAVVDVVEHDAHGLGATTALVVLAVAISAYLVVLSLVHSLGDRSPRPLGPAAVVTVLLVLVAVLTAPLGLGVGAGVLGLGLVVTGTVVWHTLRNQPVAGPVAGHNP